MQTTRLTATGPAINRLGLGAWAIGGPNWRWGWGTQREGDSIAAVHRAVELGVNWIDTAASYGLGESERVIGKAIAALPADERPLVFSKGGTRWDKSGATQHRIGAPAFIRAQCEESLRRLRLDAIDLYQLHWPSQDGTPIEETWETMAALVDEGKVRAIGVCNFDRELLERCAHVRPVTAVQMPLSLIDHIDALDLLPWCKDHDTALLAYSPMYSGLLSGNFSLARARALERTDWRSRDAEFQQPALSRNLELVSRLQPIANQKGVTVAQLAIAWSLARGATAAIVGARSPSQVDEWTSAANVWLTTDEMAAIQLVLDRSSGDALGRADATGSSQAAPNQ